MANGQRCERRNQLGESLQKYLLNGPGDVKEGPDAKLYRELASVGGPLLSQFSKTEAANSAEPIECHTERR